MTTNPLDEIQARADAATGPLCGTEGQPMNWPGKSGGCWSCDARIAETLEFLDSLSRPFIVCPQCGNKRCPKATWHGNQCSGSNTSGQSAPNPDAVFIAHAREDVPKLVAALRAVEAVHVPFNCCTEPHNRACTGCAYNTWPCPTITAIREALG